KDVSNSSLTVRTVNVGLTLLSVWDSEQSSLVDYVTLPVHHAIQPGGTLVPADVVCFSAQLFNHEGLSGTWSSSSSSILEIHPKTGVAVARDMGTVTVYYEIPGQLRTYREVVVNTVSRTVATVPSDSVRNERETKVHLTTREGGTNLMGSCSLVQLESIISLQPEKSISCHLQFTSNVVDFSAHDVYNTHTTFDPSTGLCGC
ncbi:nuclear pore membrane glycoprotein 210 isoform X1, partial [Tachysurus ichikawai]